MQDCGPFDAAHVRPMGLNESVENSDEVCEAAKIGENTGVTVPTPCALLDDAVDAIECLSDKFCIEQILEMRAIKNESFLCGELTQIRMVLRVMEV